MLFEMRRAPRPTPPCGGSECLPRTWEKAYQAHRRKVGKVGANPDGSDQVPELPPWNARAFPGNQKLILFSEMEWLKSYFLKSLVINVAIQ